MSTLGMALISSWNSFKTSCVTSHPALQMQLFVSSVLIYGRFSKELLGDVTVVDYAGTFRL